jgi:hypothetical protein
VQAENDSLRQQLAVAEAAQRRAEAQVAEEQSRYEADLRSLIDLRLQLAEAKARIAELEQG